MHFEPCMRRDLCALCAATRKGVGLVVVVARLNTATATRHTPPRRWRIPVGRRNRWLF